MDPKLEKMVRETNTLAKENHAVLKKLHRAHKWRIATKVIYWLFFVALIFGAWYFIQPYVERLTNAYDSVVETIGTISDTTNKVRNFSLFGNNDNSTTTEE